MRKLLLAFLLVCALSAAHADPITYTFTGNNDFAGTSFTYVSPGGFLAFPTGLLSPTTATDVFFEGNDYGMLTQFEFFSSSIYGLYSQGFPFRIFIRNYQIGALTPSESLTNGTLSITSAAPTVTPEPSSLLLLGTGTLSLAAAARRRLRRS